MHVQLGVAEAKNKAWFGVRESFKALDKVWTVLAESSLYASEQLEKLKSDDPDDDDDVQGQDEPEDDGEDAGEDLPNVNVREPLPLLSNAR